MHKNQLAFLEGMAWGTILWLCVYMAAQVFK